MAEAGSAEVVGTLEVEALPQRPPRARKRARTAATDETQREHALPKPQDEYGKTTEFARSPREPEASTSTDQPDVPDGASYEYLDHTADIQLHSWGDDLKSALESLGLCMFNYMTPLTGIQETSQEPKTVHAKGHDLHSLIFSFLDELLFLFHTELFVCRRIEITAFDCDAFTIDARGWGEAFDRERHAAGTEIKAITYSAMNVVEASDRTDVWVIVDI